MLLIQNKNQKKYIKSILLNKSQHFFFKKSANFLPIIDKKTVNLKTNVKLENFFKKKFIKSRYEKLEKQGRRGLLIKIRNKKGPFLILAEREKTGSKKKAGKEETISIMKFYRYFYRYFDHRIANFRAGEEESGFSEGVIIFKRTSFFLNKLINSRTLKREKEKKIFRPSEDEKKNSRKKRREKRRRRRKQRKRAVKARLFETSILDQTKLRKTVYKPLRNLLAIQTLKNRIKISCKTIW